MEEIIRIHGTSSAVTIELKDRRIHGSGELLARTGKIDGFVLSLASLKYEDGRFLSPAERVELMEKYREYSERSERNKRFCLEFD